jgi:DNA-directed RNA polymerase specialized sigma24 family protein
VTHAAEGIVQKVALKAMTREVSFESEGALLSWAFITARH